MMAYKFRMYPNEEAREKLDLSLEICRQAYNTLLGELNNQVIIYRNQIQAILPDLKICEPKFKQVYSKTLQYECYRLFSNLSALRAVKQKGRKVGSLRFKGKNWFKTINYNQKGFSFEQNGKKGFLALSKIGIIKIKSHRLVEGNIKQVTIKKSLGKWYAMIVTDFIQKRSCGEKELGVDLGINNYLMDSEGNSIPHPKTLMKYANKLKSVQQDLSRKKKGSKNRQKARIKLAKIHEKIERVRNDFLHKLSDKYAKGCKLIVIENLAIKDMMETPYFNAKNIADASWGKFISMLCYKAESAGCKVEKINPKNTTKQCSNCGNIQKMPLWIRTYKCSSCGFEINRDLNSAINILNKSLGKEFAYVENNPSVQIEQGLSMKQEAITSRGML